MLVGLQIWHILTSVSDSSHRKVYSSSSQGLHKQDDQVLQKKPLQAFHNKNLCPVDTLVLYEEKTKCLRTAISNEPYPLLISFWKPHKPDTSASISRWIKELLAKAGINTEILFIMIKSGIFISPRMQGVLTANILVMSGWSQKSTLERFYYEGNNFSKVKLSTR